MDAVVAPVLQVPPTFPEQVTLPPAQNVVAPPAVMTETTGGNAPDGRKVKATLHWVAAAQAVKAEVRLYDRLFTDADPLGNKEKDFLELLNPDSLKVLTQCYIEPFVKTAKPLDSFQFERLGYFNIDPDTTTDHIVFNRTVSLKDGFKK